MQITLFTANCTGVKTNCIYPNKVVAESKAEMVEAIKRDHVCAKYTNNYRSNDNFEEAVGIFMDNDNDHSENPADWLTAEKLSELLCDVDHVIAPSRHNMLPKDNKAARPRQHIYFPTAVFTDRKKYEELKAAIQRMYPFFDDNGKSTFWNTIARVLGNYSGKLSAEALTMNCKRNVKPEMAELKGKRLIIASELEEGTRLNTGMVKQLCSVDPIEAEKKFKDPFHFDPSHTLVLYTNHLPKALNLLVSCYCVNGGLLFQFPEPEDFIGNLIVGFLAVGL